ncbi:hypothetical protein LBMAG42_21190 [Deltaproteobacteria bacterium]|nr:hypothetical protein LBMAG42_21190 [Deltaproteobacteria bacterium]
MTLLLLLLACPGGEPDALVCAEGGTGTLRAGLDLPDEVWVTAPSLAIYAADGTPMESMTASGDLELPGGRYTIAARRGTVDGSPVGAAFGLLDDTVARVCVVDGETTTWSGTWELQPSSGKLWTLSREAAYAFDPTALAAGGDVEPELTIEVPRSNDLRGFAVDPMGNLWIATAPTYETRLLVYPPRGADGSVEPAEFNLEAYGSWAQVAALDFQAKDQLWVLLKGSNEGFAGLWGFGPTQALDWLATGEVPEAPGTTLTVEGVVAPEGIAEDASHRMWLADMASDTVFAVGSGFQDAGELSVSPEDQFLGGWDDETGTHTLNGPTALGFDDSGRLWVNYWTNPALARFDDPSSGGATRAPDLNVRGEVLELPAGLVTDHAGRVWYGNEPQDGAGELVALDGETGMELARARSADALSPTTLVFDPQ